jgi:HPt (histidine-containing phosphotransfer) domain-containing protein
VTLERRTVADVLDQGALANLLAMVGDDAAFVDELVDVYLADVPRQVGELSAALESADADALVRPAHTLKSTSQSLGGQHVADIAREIEQRGRSGSTDGVDALLAELDTALADLAAALGQARARRWASE